MRFATITRNNDFRRAYGRGRSFVGYSLVVYVCKNRNCGTRVGITSSKKIGNAVQRNRARRVIRAAVDAVIPKEGLGNVDLILVARASTAGQKSQQVAALLKKLLKKAGYLQENPAPAAAAPTAAGPAEDAPAADSAPAVSENTSGAAPTSHTSPLPENASGENTASQPLTTSASEPVPSEGPLHRQKGDDR